MHIKMRCNVLLKRSRACLWTAIKRVQRLNDECDSCFEFCLTAASFRRAYIKQLEFEVILSDIISGLSSALSAQLERNLNSATIII